MPVQGINKEAHPTHSLTHCGVLPKIACHIDQNGTMGTRS